MSIWKKMNATVRSLQTYVKEVKELLEDIEKAAKECKDNLDDAHDAQALQRAIIQSHVSIREASILADKIQEKLYRLIVSG